MGSKRRRKGQSPPLTQPAHGPDKKGRFWLAIPDSDKKLLFYGGVPGEMVTVRRGKRGRRGESGDLIQVVEPSKERREPPCRHFGVCGGCTMQHLEERRALEIKTEPHYRSLRALCPEAVLHPPVPSPGSFDYRTKVELTFLRHHEGDTSLGFLRRGRFDRGVDLGKCYLTPLQPKVTEALRGWMTRHGFRGWHPRQSEGDLRYLLYRHSSWSPQDLAGLVVDGELQLTAACLADLKACLQTAGVSGAFVVRQSSVAGAIVADAVEPLYGPQVIEERLGRLKFELGWNSFFQINPRAYERLLSAMCSWRSAPAGSRVLDLFCGVGSIGLSLYRPGDSLLGVELVEQAVVDARANAQRNGIPATFEVRSAENWDEFDTDLLVLDPPRSGCHPRLIELLSRQAPADELFYVSCNPHQLAEELPSILSRYRLLQAQAFDFFPQTHHLELLLHFVKRGT